MTAHFRSGAAPGGTISLTSFDTATIENFNSLAQSGTVASTTMPTSWDIAEAGSGANTTYTAGIGNSATGDTYSFGLAGNSDRALGEVSSGNVQSRFGASFTNNTGGTITSLDVGYTGEQWRSGDTANVTDRIDFQISTNATGLANGTWSDVDALDFTSVQTTAAAGPLDGNNPANRAARSSTITSLTIPNGATFWIRWVATDIGGSDDGLAVDDFSLTPHGTAADAAPTVTTTVPANNEVDVATNANISITFSEDVNVNGNWFQVACGSSGTRQVADTVVSGGPSTFTINPNLDFAFNEHCTVTVFASQITDQDSNDPPDTMAANAVFSFTVTSPPAIPGSVLISQVYGGGGNAGATFTNDFIELFNPGMTEVNLTGWSVQYTSSAGTTWQVTPLTGVMLQPGQYYLVQEAAGSGGTTSLPTPDATGTIAMAAGAGKVALTNSATQLSGSGCPFGASVVDFIGYGAANCSETSPAPALTNTTAAIRGAGGCSDTNDNSADFTASAPTPRNTSSATHVCGAATNPSGTGSANPSSVQPGDDSTLTVIVTPGTNPTSTGISVLADLSAIGGSSTQAFTGNGNTFTFLATVSLSTTPGPKSLPVTISDAELRSGSTTINLTVLQPPPPADHIVISQVYGGGGNSGATYTNDFVELYNPGSVSFDLTGWTLQYASATGSGWNSNKQPLGGSIGPGEYYLVSLAGGAVGSPLPAANISGQINMAAGTGKIALVSNGAGLVGNCPLADPDLVDFVGYGSSASTGNFCFEGSAPAPGGSNSSSVFRRNGGSTDTNNNNADFITGTPNARRTAPIVELGPWVSTTDPQTDGFNAPHDATISIDFSEPVDVDSGWYTISCTDSGLHTSATVATSNNFKTYAITPNVNFQFSEQCTVTVHQNAVHDQDTDDSGPNTDTLFADYVFSFDVVAAGAPAPYPPSVHLALGNPSNATADLNHPENYLMEKPTYSLSYNRDKGTPNWVSWHLDTSWFGSLARFDTFRADPAVPPDWYRVQGTDYFTTGFDRGHMTPNADRDNENRIPINQETYLMSNMVPQAPDNNQGPWADLENDLRSLLTGGGADNEIYIVSGPLGVGGTGSNGPANTIANGHVTVPAYTWKVALVLPRGDNDLSRITASTKTIAVLMPNIQGIRNEDWHTYLTTVDDIEQQTGYDFFANVPDAIENSIEAGINGVNPPGTEGQSVTTAEDTPANITLVAASPNNNQLTYSIVTPPAHGSLTGNTESRSYTPSADFNGSDSFTFQVSDGVRTSNISTVTITITDANDAPVAATDSKSTNEDTALNFPDADLTANDSAGPANETVQVLTVTSVTATAATHGSVSLSSGAVSYSPDANYNGPASFEYQVCDNGTTGGLPDPSCTTGTVNVTVNSVNDAPVLTGVPPNASVEYGSLLTFTAQATDVDTPQGSLVFSLSGAPAGASIDASSGVFTWTPTAAQAGNSYSFSVAVSDGQNSVSSNITVNVNLQTLTALGPARVWVGLKSSDDVGTTFDLLAQICKNGKLIGSGQLNNVPSGSSGFNNALLDTINLAQQGSNGFRTGDVLSITLSVRVSASSGHNSGTARLWFNDAAANSRFTATIGGVTRDYFLRSGSLLTTTAGAGPRSSIDVKVKLNDGNPFRPFGTWNFTY
jgi:DNA/RNA endonuclease G (NUC1)